MGNKGKTAALETSTERRHIPSALEEDSSSWRPIEYTFSPIWVPPQPSPAPPPAAVAYTCSKCGHAYNPEADGSGLAFEDLPDNWRCPVCNAPKSSFKSSASSSEHLI